MNKLIIKMFLCGIVSSFFHSAFLMATTDQVIGMKRGRSATQEDIADTLLSLNSGPVVKEIPNELLEFKSRYNQCFEILFKSNLSHKEWHPCFQKLSADVFEHAIKMYSAEDLTQHQELCDTVTNLLFQSAIILSGFEFKQTSLTPDDEKYLISDKDFLLVADIFQFIIGLNEKHVKEGEITLSCYYAMLSCYNFGRMQYYRAALYSNQGFESTSEKLAKAKLYFKSIGEENYDRISIQGKMWFPDIRLFIEKVHRLHLMLAQSADQKRTVTLAEILSSEHKELLSRAPVAFSFHRQKDGLYGNPPQLLIPVNVAPIQPAPPDDSYLISDEVRGCLQRIRDGIMEVRSNLP